MLLLNPTCKTDLQPVTGEHLLGATANSQDGACLDVATNGLWGGRFDRTYLDIRVFNLLVPSNRHGNPALYYRKHENQKKSMSNGYWRSSMPLSLQWFYHVLEIWDTWHHPLTTA